MNEEERLRAMWQAKLRGDTAAFNRLYREEMESRRPKNPPPRRSGFRLVKDMGDLVLCADGIYRPAPSAKE